MNVPARIKVNAFTQWGKLKTAFVGIADNACFQPTQPGHVPVLNSAQLAGIIPWPKGKKKQSVIDAANRELDNLTKVLTAHGVTVLRPQPIDWSQPLNTPDWNVDNQYCSVCPRDIIITIGHYMIEASLSRRDRYFEINAYRDAITTIWQNDDHCQWIAAPKSTMRDQMYNKSWWTLSNEQRYNNMHRYEYCINNSEIIFDAADITRCGKDIFVQPSMTTNSLAIKWLRNLLKPIGIRVHEIKFPYDFAPSHIDCTFVVLAPHLVLTNPERPIAEEDKKIWIDNGWQFIDAPLPDNPHRPIFSQSSQWLSMNLLSIDEQTVVVEEQEIGLQTLLKKHGFKVIAIPFRHVYEFGGSIHCSTWDIEREDSLIDLFPNLA